MFYGLKSDSSVATVGGANVVGPGQVIGGRAIVTLPARGELFHTLSFGADFKDFRQLLTLSTDSFSSPVTYVPIVVGYGANWQGEGRLTQLNASITSGVRGIGSSLEEFDAKRYKATGSFFIFRGDLSYTHGATRRSRIVLQGAGADWRTSRSCRASSSALADWTLCADIWSPKCSAITAQPATVELRSPNLIPVDPAVKVNVFDDFRFFAFADAGRARIKEPLPRQPQLYELASYGVGARIKVMQAFNSVVLVAYRLSSELETVANDPRLSFRIWGEF